MPSSPAPAPTGTRQSLLAAAAALLEHDGLEAVTLRAVGERAGVSRQAPYKHFADKRDLLGVLSATYLEALAGRVREAADAGGGDAVARLSRMSQAFAAFARESPHRYRLMFGAELRHAAHPAAEAAAHALGALYVQEIAAGQAAGALPGTDPMPVATLLYATSHGAVDLALSGHFKDPAVGRDPALVIAELLALLSNGARATG